MKPPIVFDLYSVFFALVCVVNSSMELSTGYMMKQTIPLLSDRVCHVDCRKVFWLTLMWAKWIIIHKHDFAFRMLVLCEKVSCMIELCVVVVSPCSINWLSLHAYVHSECSKYFFCALQMPWNSSQKQNILFVPWWLESRIATGTKQNKKKNTLIINTISPASFSTIILP